MQVWGGEMQVWGDASVGRGGARVGRGDAGVEGACMKAVWGGVMGGKLADPAQELACPCGGRAAVSGTPR